MRKMPTQALELFRKRNSTIDQQYLAMAVILAEKSSLETTRVGDVTVIIVMSKDPACKEEMKMSQIRNFSQITSAMLATDLSQTITSIVKLVINSMLEETTVKIIFPVEIDSREIVKMMKTVPLGLQRMEDTTRLQPIFVELTISEETMMAFVAVITLMKQTVKNPFVLRSSRRLRKSQLIDSERRSAIGKRRLHWSQVHHNVIDLLRRLKPMHWSA